MHTHVLINHHDYNIVIWDRDSPGILTVTSHLFILFCFGKWAMKQNNKTRIRSTKYWLLNISNLYNGWFYSPQLDRISSHQQSYCFYALIQRQTRRIWGCQPCQCQWLMIYRFGCVFVSVHLLVKIQNILVLLPKYDGKQQKRLSWKSQQAYNDLTWFTFHVTSCLDWTKWALENPLLEALGNTSDSHVH